MTYEKALKHYEENLCRFCRAKHCENCPTATAKTTMEKQIPKKPLPTKGAADMLGADEPLWGEGHCPNCEHYIRLPHKYCYKCGQAIDWSEGELNESKEKP